MACLWYYRADLLHLSERCEPLYLATDVCQDSYASVLYQIGSYNISHLPLLKTLPPNSPLPFGNITPHPVFPPSGKGVPPPLELNSVELGSDNYTPPWPLKGEQKDAIHVVRPIGYTSSLFKGAMRNYTVMEKEACSLIKGISYFQQHLYCAPESYVLTDSQSFLWALRFKSLGISRIERICIKLLALP